MVGGEGHNYLTVAPGANYRLTPAHVDRARDAIAGAACVVTQCEILPETLAHTVELAAVARAAGDPEPRARARRWPTPRSRGCRASP